MKSEKKVIDVKFIFFYKYLSKLAMGSRPGLESLFFQDFSEKFEFLDVVEIY